MLFKFLIFCICLKFVVCFPNGAPTASCETLTPNHGIGIPPRPEENPVEILFTQDTILAGALTTLHLRVRNDTWFGPIMFRGFIIQARIENPNLNVTGRVVGSFETYTGIRHVDCPMFTPNSVLTHSINNDKAFLTVQWRAPTNVQDSLIVRFYYSIAMNLSIFWTNSVSATLRVMAH